MHTPVRKKELRRKRARHAKLYLLRQRYAKAKSEGEKQKILQKVSRIAPWIKKEEFVINITK